MMKQQNKRDKTNCLEREGWEGGQGLLYIRHAVEWKPFMFWIDGHVVLVLRRHNGFWIGLMGTRVIIFTQLDRPAKAWTSLKFESFFTRHDSNDELSSFYQATVTEIQHEMSINQILQQPSLPTLIVHTHHPSWDAVWKRNMSFETCQALPPLTQGKHSGIQLL